MYFMYEIKFNITNLAQIKNSFSTKVHNCQVKNNF